MKYSKGDILICKTDIVWANGTTIFTKGMPYKILKFSKNRINGELEVVFECNEVYNTDGSINSKFDRMTEFPWTDKHLDPIVKYYIRNCFHHFYTKIEMRKLKLDKLNKL